MHVSMKKKVEWYLYHYLAIKEAIVSTRQDPMRQPVGGGRIQDPTANEAVSNVTPLPEVKLQEGSRSISVARPERVVQAIEQCLDTINPVLQELCKRKYQYKRRSMECMTAMGLTRDVYYAAVNELLQIMSLYMVEYQVIRMHKK